MNEAFLCEMILKNYEIIKGAQFIYRNKDSDTLFLFLRVTLSNLLKEFETTNKQGAPDPPRLQFQMISKHNTSSCGNKHFENMHFMNLTLRTLVNILVCIKYCCKY